MTTRGRLLLLSFCWLACSSSEPSLPRAARPDTVLHSAAYAGSSATPALPRAPDTVTILPRAQAAGPGQTGSAGPSDDDLMGAEACAGVDEVAEGAAPPADIVIAVDSTSSMTAETMFVQAQLNAFAQRVVDAQIDVRLVLICEKPGPFVSNPICIPPPLAGANCGDNEPLFKHIDALIGNHNAWEQIIATYPQYRHLLRSDAQKHIVVITDDSPMSPRASFDQRLKATDVQFEGYKFHAVYASTEFGDGPFCGEGDGSDYGRLAEDTNGVKGNLCLQNFEEVWDELALNVKENAPAGCDWEIPPSPAGETLDPERVNVHYSGAGAAPRLIGWVPSANDCGATQGWYYDDNQQPTRVLACPQTCSAIRELAHARIDIKFGCKRCTGLDVDCGGEPPPKPPELL